jgi:Zn-dependent peptidase ImmA (M78 family)
MPESVMRQELLPPLTLETLAGLKAKWKVPLQALLRRGKELEIISDRTYRYILQKITASGWKKSEY